MKWSRIASWAFLGQGALALTPAEWRSQSIYFLLTDRFARSDNSTTAACDTSQRVSLVVEGLWSETEYLTSTNIHRRTAVAAGRESSTR